MTLAQAICVRVMCVEVIRVLHHKMAAAVSALPAVSPSLTSEFERPPIPNGIKVAGGRERLTTSILHDGMGKFVLKPPLMLTASKWKDHVCPNGIGFPSRASELWEQEWQKRLLSK